MAIHSSLLLCFVILLVSMIITTNGLQCHICGQFNDGVGSITPCLNYTKEKCTSPSQGVPEKNRQILRGKHMDKRTFNEKKNKNFAINIFSIKKLLFVVLFAGREKKGNE
jgi:hypothetical protein